MTVTKDLNTSSCSGKIKTMKVYQSSSFFQLFTPTQTHIRRDWIIVDENETATVYKLYGNARGSYLYTVFFYTVHKLDNRDLSQNKLLKIQIRQEVTFVKIYYTISEKLQGPFSPRAFSSGKKSKPFEFIWQKNLKSSFCRKISLCLIF